MRQVRQTMKEMYIGLALWAVVLALILGLFSPYHLSAAFGVLAGSAVAVFIICHMARHIEISLVMDPKGARNHMQVAAFTRLAVMAAALIVSFYLWRYVHPLGVVVGLFGTKITALINPYVRRFFFKEPEQGAGT